MAFYTSWRYMPEGVRDAAKALVTDPTFVTTTMVAITAYLALWMAPEPIFSKAAAIISTIGLVAVVGFVATEIIDLARAVFRLQSDTKAARTMRDIKRASRRFGKSMGASSLRLLLALAVIKGGKSMPKPPAVPPGPAFAPAGGPVLVAGAVAVPRNAVAIQVLANGTIRTIAGGMTLARVGGSGGGGGGSPAASSSSGGGSAQVLKRHRGGNRQIEVDGRRWNVPKGKRSTDIPSADPVGDRLQAAVDRVARHVAFEQAVDHGREGRSRRPAPRVNTGGRACWSGRRGGAGWRTRWKP